MPIKVRALLFCCLATATTVGLLPTASLAAVERMTVYHVGNHRTTCDEPIRFSRDCSIRKGPIRPIAIGNFRMNIAADSNGHTLLISQIRYAPDHNGRLFVGHDDRHTVAIAAIRELRRQLRRQGVCLERWQKVRRGGDVKGYRLTFSDEAYPFLQQLTVLESEHWLPQRASRR